jgi:RNA 2',3'-cyclic 3'-phosphodiesterase
VREVDFYRYFLGFRTDPRLSRTLAAIGAGAGQRVRPGLLHLTLCVIAEVEARDRFLLSRVGAALAGQALHAVRIALGRVVGGPGGAAVRTIGRQDDLQDFYGALVRWLAGRGLAPLHRRSGLHPHVTLGHDPCRFESFNIAIEWLAGDLLLIESEVGRSRHNVLGRWPLLPPRQGLLPFDPPGAACRRAS